MKKLFLDFETYSDVDIKACGMHRYIESTNFRIVMAGWAIDNGPLHCCKWEEASELTDLLKTGDVIIVAHNASFERHCLKKYGIIVSNWIDTMHLSARAGIALGLDEAVSTLDIGAKQKTGKSLISKLHKLNYLSECDMQEFMSYCMEDVNLTRKLYELLHQFNTSSETEVVALDEKINDSGLKLDLPFIVKMIKLVETAKSVIKSGLSDDRNINYNSSKQVKDLLRTISSDVPESLDRKLLKPQTFSDEVQNVLTIREALSKASTAKYIKMIKYCCKDDIVRGLLQYYGAIKTGRWAGRGIQLQNLPRCSNSEVEKFKRDVLDINTDSQLNEYVKDNAIYAIKMASESIRSSFIPKTGKVFYIADFNAIEARVLSWIAKEPWRNEVFASRTSNIYEVSASRMFNIPVEQCGKDTEYRRIGKCAELALGYGGGVNALIRAMMLNESAVSQEERERYSSIVKKWRASNTNIVQFWRKLEEAAKHTICTGETTTVNGNIVFKIRANSNSDRWLILQLPSGRELAYYKPALIGKSITLNGDISYSLWGGLITENVVQALSRDILVEKMLAIDKVLGVNIVGHVHDEVIVEVDETNAAVNKCILDNIMTAPYNGMIIAIESNLCKHYQK